MADTLQEFKILLYQNPQGPVYYSGSEVTGTLVVKTSEPKSYNNITITLQGKGHVDWSETRGSGDDQRTYYYRANEVYVDLTNAGWSRSQAPDNVLPPGEYHFQFRFLLPPHAPTSYDKGKSAFVRYTLGGHINRGYPQPDHTIETQLAVSKIVDINTPQLRLPITMAIAKTAGFLCCTSGPVSTTLELPRTGYCIGEEIPFRVTIENHGNRNVRATAMIVDQVTYHAEGHRINGPYFQHAFIGCGEVNPRQTFVWVPEVQVLKIPLTAPPSMDSNIIKRTYGLKITTLIPNVIINPILYCPLTIGNVPHRPDTVIAPPPGALPPGAPPPGAPFPGTPYPGGPAPPLGGPAPFPGAPPPGAPPPSGHAPPTNPELIKAEPPSYADAISKF